MANSTGKVSKAKKKTSKKVAKKSRAATASKKKITKTTRKSDNKVIDPALRQKMVEETAYFNAQQRGFVPDNAIEDWLTAEKEVDEKLIKQ
ncbi:MAG: DUF2934 domain-containing protein [Sulfuriflexus sp.]|nr:DUF2934 domain-containing protein [Sulfuriflexus sp.]